MTEIRAIMPLIFYLMPQPDRPIHRLPPNLSGGDYADSR